jgi:hypothetical protein
MQLYNVIVHITYIINQSNIQAMCQHAHKCTVYNEHVSRDIQIGLCNILNVKFAYISEINFALCVRPHITVGNVTHHYRIH